MIKTKYIDLVDKLTRPKDPVNINGFHKHHTVQIEGGEYQQHHINTLKVPDFKHYRELYTKFGYGDGSCESAPFALIVGPVNANLFYNFQLETEKILLNLDNVSSVDFLRKLADRLAVAFENAPWYGWVGQQFIKRQDLRLERQNLSQSELLRRDEIQYGSEGVYELIKKLHEYLLEVWKREHPEEHSLIPKADTNTGNKILSYKRHEWKATQKELAELFIELKEKGWIDEINVAAIQACFTKSNTIGQCLKPGFSKGIRNYDQVYTPKYKQMFSNLSENQNTKE